MKKLILVLILTIVTLLTLPCSGVWAAAPTNRVHGMLDKVMAIQNNPALQGEAHREQRREAIQKVILDNFNFQSMAKEALGKQWEKLARKQRSEFEDVFQVLFGDSYTRLVLNFLHREKISYQQETIHGKTAEVKTTIYRSDEEIPVNYRLASAQKGWLVTDVTIDGVSIVENYRKTFARVIQRQSFQSLMDKMRLQQRAIKKES